MTPARDAFEALRETKDLLRLSPWEIFELGFWQGEARGEANLGKLCIQAERSGEAAGFLKGIECAANYIDTYSTGMGAEVRALTREEQAGGKDGSQ